MTGYLLRSVWTSSQAASLLIVLMLPFLFTPPAGIGENIDYVASITQSFLSLLAILVMAGLMARDDETDNAEIILTTNYPRKVILWWRFLLGIGYTLLLCLIEVAIYMLQGVISPVQAGQVALAVAGTTLFLGAVSFTCGALCKSTAAGMLIPTSYWLFDTFTKGTYSKGLYLFAFGDSRFAVGQGQLAFGLDWWGNKLLLVFLSLLLVTATSIWYERRAV